MANPIFDIKDLDLVNLTPAEWTVFLAKIRYAQQLRNSVACNSFSVGDKVRFNGKRGIKVEGSVLKVNQKNLHVKDIKTGVTWTVPATMVQGV